MSAHTPVDLLSGVIYGVLFLAVAILAWRRPAYAVAALILLDPFAFYRFIGDTALTLPKVAIIAVAVGLIARRVSLGVLLRREVALTAAAALALVLATALSIAHADYHTAALRETLKAAEYLLFFLVTVTAFFADPDEAVVRNACIAILAVVSLLALAQEFTGAPSALWVGHHAVGRIAGPLEGPNQLSGFLGLLIPVVIALVVRGGMSPWLWAVAGVGFVADILTFSRAGVAATVIAIAVTLIAGHVRTIRPWLIAIGIPLAIGGAAVLAAGGRVSRFFSNASQLQPEGLGTRSQLWGAAWTLWKRHPLFGIGADNYELELARAGYPELHTHTNSQFLQALVDGGPILLVAFVWATAQPIITLLRSRSVAPFVVGTAGALTGLAFHQILDDMTFFPKVGAIAWVLTGVALASVARAREERVNV